MEEGKFTLTRRQLLRAGVEVGALAAISYILPDFLVHALPRDQYESYEVRNGVYVGGESIMFEVNSNVFIRARVNEQAFLSGLNAIARKTKTERYLRPFIDQYPLRLALHKGRYASYLDTRHSEKPELRFSTGYLERYYLSVKSQSEEKIKKADEAIAHELRHMWQDSLGFMRLSLTANTMIVAAPANVLPKIGENLNLSTKRQIILAALGLTLGSSLSSLINPTEADAYLRSGGINSLPEFKENRGKFFSFEA